MRALDGATAVRAIRDEEVMKNEMRKRGKGETRGGGD